MRPGGTGRAEQDMANGNKLAVLVDHGEGFTVGDIW